jgi:hypothetical protein
MDSHEYGSSRCLAHVPYFYPESDVEQSARSFDTVTIEPSPSTTSSRGYAQYDHEPLISSQISSSSFFQYPSHNELVCGEGDLASVMSGSGWDQPRLDDLSTCSIQLMASNPSPWMCEYSNETIYGGSWITGHSSHWTELPAWGSEGCTFSMNVSLDTQPQGLATKDMIDDYGHDGSNDPRSQYDFSEISTQHNPITDTFTQGPTSHAQRPTKPHVCSVAECSGQFLHYADLCRHRKTVHMRPEAGQGYRCAFEGCPKADKIWARLDSFKQHVLKRHQDVDVHELVGQSARSRNGANAYFPFAITTPTTISQKPTISRK